MTKIPLLACIVAACIPGLTHAQDSATISSAPSPVSTVCGDIIGRANENLEENFVFYASDVYACWTSVPFLDAVALRYLDYYNTTIRFQSDLSYLRNPPTGYQQPAIDVLAALEGIKHNVTAGVYRNQYEFEATLQSLVLRMHNSHVTLNAGILSSFYFGSPEDIVSLSVDGKQAPQIYLLSDVISSQNQGIMPSAIKKINGIEVTTYLKDYAALNSGGTLEANADWNQLMYSPVQDILGGGNVFGWYTPFYPGDALTFTFENKPPLEIRWLALYNNLEETGPLTTGGDFYNYFVLGLLPASYIPTSNNESLEFSSESNSSLPSWNDITPAYPANPAITQDDLGTSGYVTGYLMQDDSTAVLSIPTFAAYGEFAIAFDRAIGQFIQAAKDNGTSRVVIDLQQNTGGATLLAYSTFLQFFPNIDPFGGSRRRSFPLEYSIGNATTNFWESLVPGTELFDYYYEYLAANEWVVTNRINAATGQEFTSWQQYYGPLRQYDDEFSLVERYNLSNDAFTASALEGVVFINASSAPVTPPWQASEIVLLTDGLCGSTCSLFVEMMTHKAGVRTVVVGGTPDVGPMQAASGSRGASSYSADQLDSDIAFARLVNSDASSVLPEVREQAIFTFNMGFNLRDQIRDDQGVPLQFQYQAANCRIYYTLANIFNMTQLWRDAASAIFEDNSLCVQGSTGYAVTGNSGNASIAEPPSYDPGSGDFGGILAFADNTDPSWSDQNLQGLKDGLPTKKTDAFTPPTNGVCQGQTKAISISCGGTTTTIICSPRCHKGPCGESRGICITDPARKSTDNAVNAASRQAPFGYCQPDSPASVGSFCPRPR